MICTAEVGVVGTSGEAALGYYVVIWLSEPYTLQEDKEALLDTLEQQGGGGGNEGPLNAQAATQVQALEQELRVVSDKAAAAEAELKTVNERALELSQEVEHLNDDLDRLTERNQNLSHEVAALKEGGGAGRGEPGGGGE